eukprot:3391617-Pyramimonas_sp.AAC.1
MERPSLWAWAAPRRPGSAALQLCGPLAPRTSQVAIGTLVVAVGVDEVVGAGKAVGEDVVAEGVAFAAVGALGVAVGVVAVVGAPLELSSNADSVGSA